MCDVPVFYATTEGQTRRIADYLATSLRNLGLVGTAIEIGSAEAAVVDWARVKAVAVGASVHGGKHQRQAAAFVSRHLVRLNARPSVFFSVSLSIRSSIPREVDAARAVAEAFPREVGWEPRRVVCLAGRLAYLQYGWLKRFIMRRIAAKSGGPIDTSRDYEFTDWAEVRSVAADVARMVPRCSTAAIA